MGRELGDEEVRKISRSSRLPLKTAIFWNPVFSCRETPRGERERVFLDGRWVFTGSRSSNCGPLYWKWKILGHPLISILFFLAESRTSISSGSHSFFFFFFNRPSWSHVCRIIVRQVSKQQRPHVMIRPFKISVIFFTHPILQCYLNKNTFSLKKKKKLNTKCD